MWSVTYDRNHSFIVLVTINTIIKYNHKTSIVQATSLLPRQGKVLNRLRETVVSYCVWSEMGVQKLTGENLKVVSAEFSTLS